MELTATQQSVLVGTLLGDGALAKHGHWHRLHVKHRADHIALVDYKYAVFADLVSMKVHRFDQRLNDQRYPCAQFATRTTPVLSEWHHRFYRDRRKCVPDDIEVLLTPLAVAVWFMDDGAADYAGVTIQTHNFTCAEVQRLAVVLRGRYELAATLRRNKGAWIIYVGARSLPQLQALIGPYILRDLAYKLVPRKIRYVAHDRIVTP